MYLKIVLFHTHRAQGRLQHAVLSHQELNIQKGHIRGYNNIKSSEDKFCLSTQHHCLRGCRSIKGVTDVDNTGIAIAWEGRPDNY